MEVHEELFNITAFLLIDVCYVTAVSQKLKYRFNP